MAVQSIEELFANFTQTNETTPLVVDNNYDQKAVSGLYYDNLPDDLGKGTPAEIADRVHNYDRNFYGAFRKDAGERILDIIENDTDHQIGSLELTAEVSGLSFNSVWSRPVGDNITKKDCSASFGFGYGLSNVKGEAAQAKKLGDRLHSILFAADEGEEASEE